MNNLSNKRILIRALVLTVVVWSLLTGTNTGSEDVNRGEIESGKAASVCDGPLNSKARATLPANSADMKFSYERRNHSRLAAPKRTAQVSQRALSTAVEELKERIALPFDIHGVFAECRGPDSYYDKERHEIVICYELVDAYYDLFFPEIKEQPARDEAVKGAVVSVFLHEVAHALIDGWDLPITGREEDAADQFSTLLLIDGMTDGDQIAMDGARSFKILADLEKDEWPDYSDPHSVDEQRYFNTICLIYGHRPKQYEYLIRSGTLPARRADNCEDDYVRLNKSWQKLLAPHLVTGD